MVRRIYVKKKEGFNIEEEQLLTNLKENLRIVELTNIIVLNRYDVENITEETFEQFFQNHKQINILLMSIRLTNKIIYLELNFCQVNLIKEQMLLKNVYKY